jgi:uncharacterized protein (TIGR00299 family) protein
MGRVVYWDCSAGVAGDMVLGALIDAGLPVDALRAALGNLMLPGWRLEASRVLRAGVGATKFTVEGPHHGEAATGQHAGEQHGRSIAEICALVEGSALSPGSKARTCQLFTRLAEVEASIHQVPIERVHLHEVGALDSIVDIAGAVFGLEWLGAERVVASPLNVGGGFVATAHGRLPVPAPATAALLKGVPVLSTGTEAELVTPTGALLVSAYADSYGPLPAMTVERVGSGAGDRDTPGTPNVFRLFIGAAALATGVDRILVLECEIDDMNPQLFGPVRDRLYAAGALEVYSTAIQMKKGRPGTLLTVLARPVDREVLAAIIFRETTSIGLRYREVDRLCLDREVTSVDTPLGAVRFKIARLGRDVVNAAPEFEDCARLAGKHGIPIKEVQALAVAAYRGHGRS